MFISFFQQENAKKSARRQWGATEDFDDWDDFDASQNFGKPSTKPNPVKPVQQQSHVNNKLNASPAARQPANTTIQDLSNKPIIKPVGGWRTNAPEDDKDDFIEYVIS